MDEFAQSWYLPAERADLSALRAARANLLGESKVVETLELFPRAVLITDLNRQVVHANKAVFEELGVAGMDDLFGSRFGEAWGCVHSKDMPAGCGTGEACRHCGAAKALERGLAGESCSEECGLTVRKGGREMAYDLRVWVKPFDIAGARHLFMASEDIAAEKRRTYLERIFLHDILNTAAALKGFVALLSMKGVSLSKEDMISRIGFLSESIVDEINAQRTMIAAENNLYEPQVRSVKPSAILEAVVGTLGVVNSSERRRITVAPDCPETDISTDPTLLGRVIGNMMKNALEASSPAEIVTLGCRPDGDLLLFWVHNPGCMSESVQAQLFRRSFSTKGKGRGVGSYGMKLLAEQCLKGRVWFVSTPEDGTTFYASLPRSMVP